MTKRGLIVGINYIGTGNDLRGCITDAINMQSFLVARGFIVELLLEKEATAAGIKAALKRLTANAVPGDVLVFHYSGHGSQMPSKTEADGFEEIICPIDLNWTTRVIADKDLKAIFDPVPNGVNVTLILDCCHSGSGLNQIESSCEDDHTHETQVQGADPEGTKSRYLEPPVKIVEKLATQELVNWETARDVNQSALLIAGCHANQTSADAFIEGVHQGAATYALLQILKNNPRASYHSIIKEMNAYMISGKYSQRPQLDGAKSLYPEIFAEPFGTVDLYASASEDHPEEDIFETAPFEPMPIELDTQNRSDTLALFLFLATIIVALLFVAVL